MAVGYINYFNSALWDDLQSTSQVYENGSVRSYLLAEMGTKDGKPTGKRPKLGFTYL